MNELLGQALWLTVWGMGITFAAIGVLVGGMYLLTALAKDDSAAEEAEEATTAEAEPETTALPAEEGRRLAAMAAVAVALAQAGAALHLPAREPAVAGSWDSFARQRRLTGQAQHAQRRLVRG